MLATGFAGGFNGAYVEDMLKKDGIPSRFTKTQSETRSCINILAEDESSTEYLEPGAPVSDVILHCSRINFAYKNSTLGTR